MRNPRIDAPPNLPFGGPADRWHVAINAHAQEFQKGGGSWQDMRFMYEAKTAAGEVPRLAFVFRREREGKLTQTHHQCSHDHEGTPVPDNHLTCCLGVECRACPHLLALDAAEVEPEELDVIKAWTCVTHIISQGGDMAGEGYVLAEDDRMFWDNVYTSLAMGLEEEGDDA